MNECSIERKIYYHHTDAGGVVYYGTYLQLLEEGRTELCLHAGLDYAGLLSRGFLFVVVHVEADYKAPARYGDCVAITSNVEKIGRSSVHFCQDICRAGQVLVRSKVVWVCVSRDTFEPCDVPQDFRAALAG